MCEVRRLFAVPHHFLSYVRVKLLSHTCTALFSPVLSENEENTVEQVLMCLLPLLYRQYDEPPVKSLLQHLIDQVRSGAFVLGCVGWWVVRE